MNDLGRVRLLAKDHLRLRIVSSQGEDLSSSAELRAAIGRREVHVQRNQDGLFEIASARGEEVRLLASAPGFTRVRHTARIEGQVEEVRLAPAFRVACQVQVPTGFAEHLRVWLRTEVGTLLDPDISTPETSILRNTWEHAPTGEHRLLLCAADPPHVIAVRTLRIDAAQPQAIEWNCQDLALQLAALRFQPAERATGLLLVAPSPDGSVPWASRIPADGVLLLARGRSYLLYGPHCMATTLDTESGPILELAEARSVTAAGDALTWSLVPEQPLMEHDRAVRLARPSEAYRHTPSVRLGELVGLDAHRVYEDCEHAVQVVGGTAEPPTIRGPGDTSSPVLEARRR